MEAKGRLQQGCPGTGTWNGGYGRNQEVASLFSILLSPFCTCTCFVPLSTHWFVLPLSPRDRKLLPHNTHDLYCLLLGSVPGKEILSGSVKARDQGPPVPSWCGRLTSCEGTLFQGVIVGWASIPSVSSTRIRTSIPSHNIVPGASGGPCPGCCSPAELSTLLVALHCQPQKIEVVLISCFLKTHHWNFSGAFSGCSSVSKIEEGHRVQVFRMEKKEVNLWTPPLCKQAGGTT